VGSRNATLQGLQNARRFAHVLSAGGLTVVSGLALGIDGAAHEGALSEISTEGSTVAVTGTGLDLVYPAKHRELAHQIAAHGCLVSEYPLGLSQGVLVVEAAAQSGSLITARSALEQGRDVFAIPGSIHSPLSKGCHQLIRQGAKLVESAQDILEEFHLPHTSSKEKFSPPDTSVNSANTSAVTNQLLTAAGHDPVSVDELVMRTGLTLAEVQASLLDLELAGHIERLASGMYQALH
jgi:DNA processing protein